MEDEVPPPLPPRLYKLSKGCSLGVNAQPDLLLNNNNLDLENKSNINVDQSNLILASKVEKISFTSVNKSKTWQTSGCEHGIASLDSLINKNFDEFSRKDSPEEGLNIKNRSQTVTMKLDDKALTDTDLDRTQKVIEETIIDTEAPLEKPPPFSGEQISYPDYGPPPPLPPRPPVLLERSALSEKPKVPERPPQPLKKFRTLPYSMELSKSNVREDKYDMFESLFNKVVETNEDIIDFGIAITELRKSFKHEDKETNSGLMIPLLVRNPLPSTDVMVSIFFHSNCDNESVMKCIFSWTGKEICNHFFSTFCTGLNAMDLFLYSNQYVLKMVGFEMYLLDNVPMCDHALIQEWKKQGKPIKFDLVCKTHGHTTKNLSRTITDDTVAPPLCNLCQTSGPTTRPLSRTDKDDLMLHKCNINFEYFFEKPDLISVSEQGLNILLETFDKEVSALVNKVPDAVSSNAGHFVLDQVIQVAKAISTVLATIDLPQIQDAIKLLKSLTRVAEDNASSMEENSYIQEKSVISNERDSIKPFDKSLFDLGLQQLAHGLYYLIELYCKSFELKFELGESQLFWESYLNDIFHQQVDKKCNADIYERVDPRTINDNFVVKIESVHRIPSEWKFNFIDFQIEVGLYYGGNLLCPVEKCAKSNVDKGFFEHISFRKVIDFNIPVGKIPREAKLGFVLYGVISTLNTTALCWFTCNVYNYQGFLISGSRLFGLLHDVDFDPVATCATNYIHQCDNVILHVHFQIYPIEVMFPQPFLFLTPDQPLNHEIRSTDLDLFMKIQQKDVLQLTDQDKTFIWNNRFALNEYPKALVYILSSVTSWDAENVLLIHNMLNSWKNVNSHNSLKLLEGTFPDKIVRGHAVMCMNSISDDELFEYLPGLVQALKYETYHNSGLALFLIKRALCSVRLCHYLYWYLKYYVEDVQFGQRYKTILSGLLHVCGQRLRQEFTKQDNLIKGLIKAANVVKESKDSVRKSTLQNVLKNLNDELDSPYFLPYDPAIKVSKIVAEDSLYFSSYTFPLKVLFQNSDPLGENVNVIFKVGDDLRKDLLTIQLFRIMNILWLNNGLDLKIMLYNVLPTGPFAGFIEMVPNSTTLREIHVLYGGVTGSFKRDCLSLWLQQFNTTKDMYQEAIKNLTASAAGYCVATYILGIGDRHNDNIMITKNGHLFHIDFSKYMGDIQRFGTIKRDRVPFVLTPDMAYVINNGITPSQNFQVFIEHCCKAFNILRRHRTKLLNVLSLMMYADIAYVSPKADLEYVYQSLQLHLTDEEAEMYFSQLIQNSLSSMSTQLNFFIHNVAHMKDPSDSSVKKANRASGFSFSNERHSFGTGTGVDSARVVDFQKRYVPAKHYMFVINIIRRRGSTANFVFRRYEDFQELHGNICSSFSVFDFELPQLPQKLVIGRSQISEVAQERRLDLDNYLEALSKIPIIWSSEIMATFLYSYIRDHEEEQKFTEAVVYLEQGWKSRVGGRIKISMVYDQRFLKIYIMHVSDLVPRRIQGLADSYVKAYLLPDFMKHTKRKTKTCYKSLNPTFNETFTYNLPLELLKNRVLEVSVWDQVSLTEKEFLGGVRYYFTHFNPENTNSGWFTLVDIDFER